MTAVLTNKIQLVGVSYAEMPHDGKRYRFCIERYRDDDGSEWGCVVSQEEVPDVGPYLWIPSYGAESAEEAQYLYEEHEYEQAHPNAEEQEWWAEHRATQQQKLHMYDEARDRRAELIKRSPRTGGQP